jgi:hypothetical protein
MIVDLGVGLLPLDAARSSSDTFGELSAEKADCSSNAGRARSCCRRVAELVAQ